MLQEFNEQISNIFSDNDSEIELQIKDQTINIIIVNNELKQIQNEISLHTEAIYLDDPFVIDDVVYMTPRYRGRYMDHRSHLKEKLFFSETKTNTVDELVVNKKLEEISNKIATVCEGDIFREKYAGLSYNKWKW